MAVTRVDETHRLNEAVDYTVKGKPHFDNKYIQGKRALEINSINASCNPKDFKFETHSFLKHNVKNRRGTYTGIRTIISFDPKKLNYQNLNDRHTALAIGTRVAKRKYPNNQSLIVLQADNKNHILHDHIITCTRRLDNGLSSSSGATFKDTVPYTDEALEHYGLKPLQTDYHSAEPTNHAVYGLHKRGKYSFVQDLYNRIVKSYQHATNADQFFTNLHKNNVGIKPIVKLKKNKQTGKYEYHFYKNPANKSKYQKITQSLVRDCYKRDPTVARNSHIEKHLNQYLRLRPHITYVFKDKYGKNRVVRARKLGKNTDMNGIAKILNQNKSKLQHKQQPQQQTRQPIHQHTHSTYTPHVQHTYRTKKRKYTLADLKPTKQIWTEDKKTLGHTHNKIGKYWEPRMYRRPIKEPVMKFQPKSHPISKALDTAIYSLNKIAQATQAGTSERQRQMEIFEEECEFDKETAKKIEINQANKEAYYKVQSDNRAYNALFRKNQFKYNQALKREQLREAHFQGPSLF